MLHGYFWTHSPNSSPTPTWGLLAYLSTVLPATAFHSPVLLPRKSHGWRSLVGYSPWGHYKSRLSNFTFTFHFHALEKEMATHSSVLAWRIPGTGQPGGLLSMGSHRVGHDWSDLAAAAFPSSVAASNTLQPHWKFLKAKNDFWCFLSDPFKPQEPNAGGMVAVTK